MGEEIQGSARDAQREVSRWTKAIPQARDRLQSKWLVMLMVPALALAAVASCVGLVLSERGGLPRFPVLFSVAFAVLVWAMRSATLPAAGVGLLVCLTLSLRGSVGFFPRPALSALIVLFVLTFGATRYGRRRKETRGLAEARSGRRASQVVANLGVGRDFCRVGMGWRMSGGAGRGDRGYSVVGDWAGDRRGNVVDYEVSSSACGNGRRRERGGDFGWNAWGRFGGDSGVAGPCAVD